MPMTKPLKQTAYLILLFMLFSAVAQAEPINDKRALGSLQEGKGVFLVDIGDINKMNFYLEIIQGTHRGMKAQGVEPDFVIVYIGPSVKYLTSKPAADIEAAHAATLMDVALNVEKLDELGIRQEICNVANEAFGIDNETVLPQLDIVGDGFISLIGYQAQGYHLVPVF